MVRKYIKALLGVLLVLGFSVNESHAQRWFKASSLEFGVIGGFSHYSGELTNNKFMETKGLKGNFGIITRYTPRELVTFRLSAQYGGIEGDDAWYEDQNDETRRNLNFTSSLWDFTGAAEFNFNRMDTRQKSGVSPYAFIGVSVFKYNPKAVFNFDASTDLAAYLGASYLDLNSRDGEEVELQPLATEGQETTEFNDRERYALTQMAIPVGAGFKFKMNHKWTVGIEYGARITFTDYLDDVSGSYVDPTRLQAQYGAMSAAMSVRSPQFDPALIENSPRGDADKNDLYGIFGLSLTYRIYGNRAICPTF
ncbi:MAG: DUF6089 family protein [Bacteroidia bacterium]